MSNPKKFNLKFSSSLKEHAVASALITLIVIPFAMTTSSNRGFPMSFSEVAVFAACCFAAVNILLVLFYDFPLDVIQTWKKDGGKHKMTVILCLATALLVYGPTLAKEVLAIVTEFKK